MILEVNENDAFIKISITEENGLNFKYGFNIVPPAEGFDLETPEGQAMADCIGLIAGLVYLSQNSIEDLIDIGEAAIENGDFVIDVEGGAEMAEFMDGLTEEQMRLLDATPKGEA